jgi:hypothetical protein
MPSDPYTIRVFVPDGDPEGVRIIDRMNWTGMGIVFPRESWPDTKMRREFDNPGVYILSGYSEEDDDLPMLYIGEGDGIRDRLESHFKNKDFWTRGIAFVSTNRGLNKAHVQWLEYALVKQAMDAKRCKLENGNQPQEPALTESEKADTRGFLKEILQILPLAGLQAFEIAKAIIERPTTPSSTVLSSSNTGPDTVVVPAREDGFQRVYLGENRWYAIRISGGMLRQLKWVAAYRVQPRSAITHVAPIARIEPWGESGKYVLYFSEPPKEISPIPLGDAPPGTMQGPRHTTYAKLMTAKKLTDLFPKT